MKRLRPGRSRCRSQWWFVAGFQRLQAGMGEEPTLAASASKGVRHDMWEEGHLLVDAARSEGITLRLLGGLGVREHCHSLELCERDYSDLDMVIPAELAQRLGAVLARFGYAENVGVKVTTGNAEMQFVRPCQHGGPGANRSHADDHIDVFLDTFRMDHEIALARRLEIEPYTLSLSDLLLTKLQIFRLNDKDTRDIVTLLADAEVGDNEAPGVIDSRYIGRLCADDWGLFYDVATNLQRVDERATAFELNGPQVAHVRHGALRLIAAIDAAPKSLRWRLRARVGTHKMWHAEPDGQE
jgi:hypothetical protein